MKILSLSADDISPIAHLEILDMGDMIIVAGANGSGKTRLKEAIIETFRNPNSPQLNLHIQATREQEEKSWAAKEIDVVKGQPSDVLQRYMDSRTRGGTYKGAVIQVDSQRVIQNVKYEALTWSTPDPDDTELDQKLFLRPFTDQWQDIVSKIFQKAASRRQKVFEFAEKNQRKTNRESLEKYPDPFIPFKEVFSQLLPDKVLEDIDPANPKEFHYRNSERKSLPFHTLSSGEQEVVKIIFNVLWKQISDCVFLIDEPELHLHPTLTFRLVETLKRVGKGTNQFIFFTHSADLISTYYSTGNVYFLDSSKGTPNAAQKLSVLGEQHNELVQLVSENLGLFAVGKKIVFVEGDTSSVDRLAFHAVAQKYFPEAQIVAVGSVENIMSLNRIAEEIKNTIFGISLFMIRDRDGLTDEQIEKLESTGHVKCLPRRHVENYFLDAELLAKAGERLVLDQQWQDVPHIEKELLAIANESLPFAVTAAIQEYLRTNGIVEIPRSRDLQNKSKEEIAEEISSRVSKVSNAFSKQQIENLFDSEQAKLQKSLTDGSWKSLFPGKHIFNSYCGKCGVHSLRMQKAFVEAAVNDDQTVALKDIIDILTFFKNRNVA